MTDEQHYPPESPGPLGMEPRKGSSYDPTLDAAAQIAEEQRAEMEAAARAIDRAARRRTLLIGAVVVAVVLVVSAVVAGVTTRRQPSGSVAISSDAFSGDGHAVPGAQSAQFSPDGTQLAVLRGGGAFGVSEAGRFRPLVPAETNITAFGWFDGARLLVQEGPISTGQLAALDLHGESKGVITLNPDVQPGNGLAVAPDRQTVVLASSDDGGVPGAQPVVDLYAVAVVGGATHRLTNDRDVESHPVFLDDHRVAFTSHAGEAEKVEVLDIADGTKTDLTKPATQSTVIGVAQGEVVWTTGEEVRAARPGGAARSLAPVPSGSAAVAISPEGKRLVVRESSPEGDTILHLVRL